MSADRRSDFALLRRVTGVDTDPEAMGTLRFGAW
jgi:hypothetical protein